MKGVGIFSIILSSLFFAMSATLELRQQSPAAVCDQEYSGSHNNLTFVFHIKSLFNSWQYIVQVQSKKQRGHFSIVY